MRKLLCTSIAVVAMLAVAATSAFADDDDDDDDRDGYRRTPCHINDIIYTDFPQQIVIFGTNLQKRDKIPTVTIGGRSTVVDPDPGATNDDQVTASFDSLLEPGAYVVVLKRSDWDDDDDDCNAAEITIGAVGPQGPQGKKGEDGEDGQDGSSAATYTRTATDSKTASMAVATATASCDSSDDPALGGGYSATGATFMQPSSFPVVAIANNPATGWTANVTKSSGTGTLTLTVYVICRDDTP